MGTIPPAHRQVRPDVSVLLNNNPRCEVELENVLKGEKWTGVNVPHAVVTGWGFPNGTTTLQLSCGSQLLGKKGIDIADHKFSETVELPCPLDSPEDIVVAVGPDFRREVPVPLTRIYGMARYYNGEPVCRPIVSAMGMAAAVGGDDGYFEIVLSGRARSVGIFAPDYSKATLECWLWEVPLVEHTRLDVRIGGLEVYELGAWVSSKGSYAPDILIHFIPMSLTRINQATAGRKDVGVSPEAWPHLKPDDVEVFIGEQQVPIKTFHQYPDPISESCTRPGYILAVPGRDHEGKILKVQVHDHVQISGRDIMERGEGFFLGFLAPGGYDRL